MSGNEIVGLLFVMWIVAVALIVLCLSVFVSLHILRWLVRFLIKP